MLIVKLGTVYNQWYSNPEDINHLLTGFQLKIILVQCTRVIYDIII